ncbi:hypothetical protein GCM10022254_39560 [Actinomadura meridiana]|uniref:DUF885 domain-containing protein n=1 Tax=Actinomadura meridiana TaxID=559626 RepID=A0ABP8C6J4_9ACTN
MELRDEVENVLRAWDAYEIGHGGAPVIDFDCAPGGGAPEAAPDRLAVYRRLVELRERATGVVAVRLDADLAYLGALLGERLPLDDYVRATQGCGVAGWSDAYVAEQAEEVRKALGDLGIGWGARANAELREVEGLLDVKEAPDAIRQAAEELEPVVRAATECSAPYRLTVETVDLDVYWAFWLDGVGDHVRLRLNLANVEFTEVGARQFALHEVLGHGLQSAALTKQAADGDVPWVRLLSIHAPQSVMSEGIAQAWPLFLMPEDKVLTTRVRLGHYMQLVLAQVHLAINEGTSISVCADRVRDALPWWSDKAIARCLTDRGADPQHRSYMWSYPAGIEWFAALAEADQATRALVLKDAYRLPLAPDDLAARWPAGPPVGGPGV